MPRLRQWDTDVVGGVADIDHGPAGRVLRWLGKAGDYSLLWVGVAATLAIAGPRGRRGALRGWLAIGLNSLLSHPLKALVQRDRPADGLVATHRRPDATTTHAMPSGHTGAAVAFVLGASADLPPAGWMLAPLAAAVAYARLYVGLHHPTDLVVGAGLGTLAGVAARRLPVGRVLDPA